MFYGIASSAENLYFVGVGEGAIMVVHVERPMGLRTVHGLMKHAAEQYAQRDAKAQQEAYQYMTNDERVNGYFQHPLKPKKVISGRERESVLMEALDQFKFERSDLQRKFHDSMFLASLDHVYKEQLASEAISIKRRYKVSNIDKRGTAILGARRIGKSYSIASYIAAYMIAVEDSTQLVFSTGSRASELVLNLVYKFLLNYNDGEFSQNIIKKNKEDLWVRGPIGNNDIRKLKCVPSCVEIRTNDDQITLSRRQNIFYYTNTNPSLRNTFLYRIQSRAASLVEGIAVVAIFRKISDAE